MAAGSRQQAAHLGNTTVAGAGRLRPVWTRPPVVFGWPNTPCAQPTQTDCDEGWHAWGEPTERPNRRPSIHLGTKKYGHLGRWRSHRRPSSSMAASRHRCPAAARPVRGQRSRRASQAAPSPNPHPTAAAAAQPPPPPAAPPSSPAKPSYQRASAGPGYCRGSPAPPTTRSAPAAGRRRYRRQGALVLCYPC